MIWPLGLLVLSLLLVRVRLVHDEMERMQAHVATLTAEPEPEETCEDRLMYWWQSKTVWGALLCILLGFTEALLPSLIGLNVLQSHGIAVLLISMGVIGTIVAIVRLGSHPIQVSDIDDPRIRFGFREAQLKAAEREVDRGPRLHELRGEDTDKIHTINKNFEIIGKYMDAIENRDLSDAVSVGDKKFNFGAI